MVRVRVRLGLGLGLGRVRVRVRVRESVFLRRVEVVEGYVYVIGLGLSKG